MIEITHVGACAYVLIPNKHSGQPAWVVFPGRQHFTHVTISCWSNQASPRKGFLEARPWFPLNFILYIFSFC